MDRLDSCNLPSFSPLVDSRSRKHGHIDHHDGTFTERDSSAAQTYGLGRSLLSAPLIVFQREADQVMDWQFLTLQPERMGMPQPQQRTGGGVRLAKDGSNIADYLLDKTTRLVDQMLVHPERMRRNLDMTQGLVFSGQLLLDLAAAGMLRESAYRLVQGHAMQAWQDESDFRAAIQGDPDIGKFLTSGQLAESFSLERQLRNVDRIFARVFGG